MTTHRLSRDVSLPAVCRFAAGRRLLVLALAVGVGAGALVAGCASSPPTASELQADPLLAQRRGEELAYQAEQAVASNRPDDAIILYRQSLAVYNEHPSAWNNLGVLYQTRGNVREAASAFLAASNMNPRNPTYPTNLGLLFQDLRQYDESAKWFDLALERDPAHLPALRESVRLDQARARTSEQTYNRIRAALRLETDPKWKTYLQRQQDMVGARLRESGNILGP